MVLAQPVYSSSGAMIIPSDTILQENQLSNLVNRGIAEVWIVDERMKGVDIEDAISSVLKIKTLQTVRTIYQKAAKEQDPEKISVPHAVLNHIVSDLLDEIALSKNKVISTFTVDSFENYLPVHVTNVTILSLVMGKEFGLNDKNLFELGIGALLYDIGMTFMPQEILYLEPNLSPSQWETLHKHTEIGFKVLQLNPMISATSQSIALQHHEKFDGSGYPRSLSKDQIHIFSRILSIADVYDSLLSDRPNREKFKPHEAYEYVITAGGFDFDLDVVQAFTRCIAPYPVGTMVKLNSGEQGVVSKITKGLATRPSIRLFYDKEGNDIKKIVDINLVENPSVLIEDTIEN